MPRYFFHVKDGVRLINDNIGMVLADLDAAQAEAHSHASEVSSMLRSSKQLINELSVEVTDLSGRIVATVPLKT